MSTRLVRTRGFTSLEKGAVSRSLDRLLEVARVQAVEAVAVAEVEAIGAVAAASMTVASFLSEAEMVLLARNPGAEAHLRLARDAAAASTLNVFRRLERRLT